MGREKGRAMKTRASYIAASAVCLGSALLVNACGIETDGASGVSTAGGRAGASGKAGTGGVGGGEGGFAGTFVNAGNGGVGSDGGTGGTGGIAGKGGSPGGKGGASGAGSGGVSGAAGKGGVSGTGGVAGTGGVSGSAGKGGTAGAGGAGGKGGASGVGGASGTGGNGGLSGASGAAGVGGEAGTAGTSGAGGAAGMGGDAGAGGGGAGGTDGGSGGSAGAAGGGAGGGTGGGGTGGAPAICSSLGLPVRTVGGVGVTLPSGDNPVELTVALTLEAWVYPLAYGGIGTEIIGHWDAPGNGAGYAFELSPTGEIQLVTGPVADTPKFARSTAIVPLSAWSHVAVTLAADGTFVNLAFWLNGKPSGVARLPAPKFSPSVGLEIGHLPQVDPTKQFIGFLDEVRVSSSTEYVSDFSTALRTRLSAVPGSTVVLYHFDSQTGGMVSDSSGAARDGQLVPAAELSPVCPPPL